MALAGRRHRKRRRHHARATDAVRVWHSHDRPRGRHHRWELRHLAAQLHCGHRRDRQGGPDPLLDRRGHRLGAPTVRGPGGGRLCQRRGAARGQSGGHDAGLWQRAADRLRQSAQGRRARDIGLRGYVWRQPGIAVSDVVRGDPLLPGGRRRRGWRASAVAGRPPSRVHRRRASREAVRRRPVDCRCRTALPAADPRSGRLGQRILHLPGHSGAGCARL